MAVKHKGKADPLASRFGRGPQVLFLVAVVLIIAAAAVMSVGRGSTTGNAIVETYTRACLNSSDKSTCLPDSMFRELPPMSSDFWPTLTIIRSGRVEDICSKINESYWKQPEMLVTFPSTGIPSMLSLGTGETIMGYGAFPAEVLTSIDPKKDNVIRTCFFVAAGWRVSRYQGMQILPAYPGDIGLLENRFSDGTQSVSQDSRKNQDYFKIEVSPKDMLLAPAWGYFYYDWIQKVDVVITVDPNTPPGKYIIGVGPASPDPTKDQEWLWQYKTLYVSAGLFGLDRPFYSIGVEVV